VLVARVRRPVEVVEPEGVEELEPAPV